MPLKSLHGSLFTQFIWTEVGHPVPLFSRTSGIVTCQFFAKGRLETMR